MLRNFLEALQKKGRQQQKYKTILHGDILNFLKSLLIKSSKLQKLLNQFLLNSYDQSAYETSNDSIKIQFEVESNAKNVAESFLRDLEISLRYRIPA